MEIRTYSVPQGSYGLPPLCELEYDWVPSRQSDEPLAATVASIAGLPQNPLTLAASSQAAAAVANPSHVPEGDSLASPPSASYDEIPYGICHQFYRHGACERVGCQYRHTRSLPQSAPSQERQSDNIDGYRPQYSSYDKGERRTSPYRGQGYQQQQSYRGGGSYRSGSDDGGQREKICFAYQNGHCRFGQNCIFSHQE